MSAYHNIEDVEKISSNYIYADYSNYNILSKFLYLTPRAFLNYSFMDRIAQLNADGRISLIVLDEIHCISNWSHDFRPDYLMLANNLKTFLGHTRIMGFTATINFKVIRCKW